MEKTNYPKRTPSFANNIIPPEHVKPNTEYTFTVNSNDARQYFDKEDRQELVINDMAKWMANRSKYLNVELYLEVSCIGRLHWHGTLSFVDNEAIRRFYVNDIHGLITYNIIEIDYMKDEEFWKDDYCVKQEHFMKFVMTSKYAVNHYLENIQKVVLNPKLFKPIHEC